MTKTLQFQSDLLFQGCFTVDHGAHMKKLKVEVTEIEMSVCCFHLSQDGVFKVEVTEIEMSVCCFHLSQDGLFFS